MIRVNLGDAGKYCDGWNRRSFLQIGLAGMGAATLGDVNYARELSKAAGVNGKNTSMILLWLDGGPSHMDLYDLKPDAPVEYRGIWRPIQTNVPGMDIGELFPLQAKIADKFSIIRSLHHDTGDHFAAGHRILTGRAAGVSGASAAGKYPFFGAIATKVLGARSEGMPPFVGIPYSMSIGRRPGYFGGHQLGIQHNPFETNGDPNAKNFKVQNVTPHGQLSMKRLSDRRGLSRKFDSFKRAIEHNGQIEALNRFDQQAFQLVTSERARKAFDIESEDSKLRDSYGRNSWGQSALLARRLVEAGTTVVTCHFGGWDHHWNLKSGYDNYLPRVDQAVSGLLNDLDHRGILDETLVVLCGEFSRTPRMNNGGNGGPPLSKGTPGRDHWGNAMFCFLAGGGLRGGQVIGSTNRLGESPKDRPLRPGDIHHTIFHVLGVDPAVQYTDHSGRPISAIDHGAIIDELV